MLPIHEINPPQPAEASVIFLHGLGANGHDLMPLVPQLGLSENHHIRFIFPDAPLKSITINGGMLMPAWYDITGFSAQAREDLGGFEVSRWAIEEIIQHEIDRGIPEDKIILGGFSQGGALTLFTSLQTKYKLAGSIVLSAYLPCATHIQQHISAHARNTPIFMAHGTHDPIVLFDWGQTSQQMMSLFGFNIEWRTYPIGHEVSEAEIIALGKFIERTCRAE